MVGVACLLLSYASLVSSALAGDKPIHIGVKTLDGTMHSGTILYASDTLLVLWQGKKGYDSSLVDRFATVFPVRAIGEIRFTKKGNFLSGLGLGVLIGGGAGALIGLASSGGEIGGVHFTTKGKAIILGVTLGITGGLVGGIVGAVKDRDEKVKISGSREAYARIQWRLQAGARYPHDPPLELRAFMQMQGK